VAGEDRFALSGPAFADQHQREDYSITGMVQETTLDNRDMVTSCKRRKHDTKTPHYSLSVRFVATPPDFAT
jgi:hypothetical protein